MTEMTQSIVIKKIIAMVNKSGDMKLCLESDKSSMIVKNKSATIAVFIKNTGVQLYNLFWRFSYNMYKILNW